MASIDKRFARADQQAQRLFAKGSVLQAAGQFDEAITNLRESLRLDSANAEAYTELSDCYTEKKNWAAAINTLERMVRRYPDLSIAYGYLAFAHLGQFQKISDVKLMLKAQQYVEKSLQLNPGNLLGLIGKSSLLMLQGKLVEAVPYAQKAVIINPSIAEMHYMLGRAMTIKGDTVAARFSLQRADSLGLRNADTNYSWGQLAEKRQDFPAAERYYRQGLAIDSTSAQNLSGLAGALLNQEKKAALALPIYRRLQRKYPDDADYWYSPGSIYFAQKNFAKALTMFQEAIKRDNNQYYQLMLGSTYLSLKQYVAAVEAFEAAFRLDSTNALSALLAAQTYANFLKQPDRAFSLASRAVRLAWAVPTQPIAKDQQQWVNEAGDVLYKTARLPAQYEEAIYWQKQLLAAAPKGPHIGQYNYQIGVGYEKLNRLADATTHLREAIRLSPNEISYRNLLAEVLLRDNKPARAETEARYIIRLDSANVGGNSTLAVALLRQGRYAKAWPIIQHVERICPADSWQAPYLYARWHARQRNVPEALKQLETTLKRGFASTFPTHIQTNPDFDPIRQNGGYIKLMQHYFPPAK